MLSRYERSNWRDERISKWHRTTGTNCPAVDLDTIVTTTDFVDDDTSDGLRLLEFDMAEPVALIDYKHDKARIDFGHSSVVAQAAFASRASLPSFVVRYTDDFGHFTIYPTNSYARKLAPNGIRLTEEYFVRFLYKLRGRKIPSDVQEQVEARAAARLEANAV